MKTTQERFDAKYIPEALTGCWIWTASLGKTTGYGRMAMHPGNPMWAHRISYQLHKGEIPAGLQVDHICRNRACVNPDHLCAVTGKENMANSSKVLRTKCNHGHEFTPENTSQHKGYRRCKECHRLEMREYHAKRNTN